MSCTTAEREKFSATIALELDDKEHQRWSLDSRIDYARRLMRLGATYGRLQELACNRELTAAEVRREDGLEKRISELIAYSSKIIDRS